MMQVLWRGLGVLAAGGALCLASSPPTLAAGAGDRLVWRVPENTVDADIEGWPLQKLLERVAAKTRWRVYVEPDTQRRVTAKFKELKPGEALRRLLGELNFVLLPSTNGTSTLYVFHTSVQTATNLVASPAERRAGAARLVANELVVHLKPGAGVSIEDLAKQLGAQVVGSIAGAQTYRLRFGDASGTDAARATLGTHRDVGELESNYALPRPDEPEGVSVTPGLAPLRLRPQTDGRQIVVGLIDTAVQSEGTVLKDFLLPTVSVAGQTSPPLDEPSHGSSMAETLLYSLARSAEAANSTPVRILPIDVYGSADSTTTFQIAQGIQEAVSRGAAIVNLSLGGDTDSPLLRSLITAAHREGVIFTAAAGNEPVTTPTFPAAYPEVIAVTAMSPGGAVASYANRGEFVDVAAPGTSIVPFAGEAYVVVGTSTATANVSAVAAGLLASTGKSGAAVESMVRQALAFKAQPASPAP
jgi:hypothetical protein